MPNSLRARLKNLVHKGILTQKDLDRIVIVPVDETKENKKSIQASEYETWGKFCDEEYEELDFVQPHKKIGVNLVPCEDAISRKDTLKAMIEQLGIRNEDYLIPAEATLYKVVKNMPSVNTEKTGRWIKKKSMIYCSECCDGFDVFTLNDPFKYCPNCGARMREAGETD